MQDRAEGIDEHQPGADRLDFGRDPLEDGVQVAGQRDIGEIDEVHRAADRAGVEVVELLLVAQHLQGRFAEHGEVQGRPLRRRQREHHLVRQGGLPAAGRAADQVERILRDAAPEDLIQAGDAGNQAIESPRFAHEVWS